VAGLGNGNAQGALVYHLLRSLELDLFALDGAGARARGRSVRRVRASESYSNFTRYDNADSLVAFGHETQNSSRGYQ
jgi:hypothetical protein